MLLLSLWATRWALGTKIRQGNDCYTENSVIYQDFDAKSVYVDDRRIITRININEKLFGDGNANNALGSKFLILHGEKKNMVGSLQPKCGGVNLSNSNIDPQRKIQTYSGFLKQRNCPGKAFIFHTLEAWTFLQVRKVIFYNDK